jgi:hypothetical protein
MRRFTCFVVLIWPIAIFAQPFSFMNVSHSTWPVVNAAIAVDSTDNLYVFWQDSTGGLAYGFWREGLWSKTLTISEGAPLFEDLIATSIGDTCYIAWVEESDSSTVSYIKVAEEYVSSPFLQIQLGMRTGFTWPASFRISGLSAKNCSRIRPCSWVPEGLASGVYVYRLSLRSARRARQITATRKLVLLR